MKDLIGVGTDNSFSNSPTHSSPNIVLSKTDRDCWIDLLLNTGVQFYKPTNNSIEIECDFGGRLKLKFDELGGVVGIEAEGPEWF
jgi:hypothetical protein